MIKVNKNLYRGPRPTGQIFNEMVSLGIKYSIDLESGAFEFLHNDYYESIDFAKYGMEELDFTCSDISPPTSDHVKAVFDVIAKGEPTYVHCLHGNDRTGFVMAAYRMDHQGWTFKDAAKEMFDLGFHKCPYIFWLWALRKYAKKDNLPKPS